MGLWMAPQQPLLNALRHSQQLGHLLLQPRRIGLQIEQ
jgi:hypothetical protein